ncbi:MAG: YHS domain-containing protein [Chloroflexi bacterium]|nr:YHS domain-containing protein [Chloroflexota bacterium]
METDPVCDMKVDPKASLQHVHLGKTYYFCAPACQRAFAKSPETYLVK